MKYLLIKNAQVDLDFYEGKLTDGELLFESENFWECKEKIPFPMDNPRNRLKDAEANWSYYRKEAEKRIPFFEQLIKNRTEDMVPYDSFELEQLCYFPGSSDDVYANPLLRKPLVQQILGHYHYAINVLTENPPLSALAWFEMGTLVDKDWANRIIPLYCKALTDLQTNGTSGNYVIERIQNSITSETEVLNQPPFTEDSLTDYYRNSECYRDLCEFKNHPDKNGVNPYMDECDDFVETYTIFIDFSEPDKLFNELKSQIENLNASNITAKVHWTENFIENIWRRLIVRPEDARTAAEVNNDYDKLWNDVFNLLDLNDQENEWIWEDIMK